MPAACTKWKSVGCRSKVDTEGGERPAIQDREGAQPELRLVAVHPAGHLAEAGDARREPEREQAGDGAASPQERARAGGRGTYAALQPSAESVDGGELQRRRRGPPPGARARAAGASAPRAATARGRGGRSARHGSARAPAAPVVGGLATRGGEAGGESRGAAAIPRALRATAQRDLGALRRARAPRRAARGSSRAAAQAAGASGSRTVKVLPLPGSLSTPTSPPWARAISRASARPRPAPGPVRGLAARTRW